MKKYILLSIFLITISTIGFSQNQINFKEIHPPNQSISPTILELQKSDPTTLPRTLNRLWTKLKNESTPLIEKDPLNDGYVYMTLIHRDSTKNKDISFEVFGIYDEYRFGDMKMHKLKDTDLYYRCYMVPDDLCFSYRFILNDSIKNEKQFITDPLNNQLIPTEEKKDYSWSVFDLRTNKTDWYTKQLDNPGSKIDTFQITSNVLHNTRNIYVYLPQDYDNSNKKYPVMYLFDSFIYLNRIEVPNTLDNLIHENTIEPIIAVFIDNPTNISRKYELPLNPLFKDFMAKELIPEIKMKYNITNKPEKTILGGMSYGGLAATYIAFECDSIFGKVLSQSGSFWRDLELNDINGIEVRNDWLINRFLVENNKNLKIFLDWGLQENWCLLSGRRMIRALDKKGYPYKFTEFNGWHDWSNSRKTFPVGLIYLLNN